MASVLVADAAGVSGRRGRGGRAACLWWDGWRALLKLRRKVRLLHREVGEQTKYVDEESSTAAVVLAGQLLICGGACRGSHHNKEGRLPVNSVERFDEETEAWEYMPSMSMRRTDAAGAVLATLY
eukprot:CAMPEP_0115322142 /NCGR_PEP_ID=MMETSP0270-20121206/81239_1 /TAXON_ID=71861 /ORGANISM="Scrippsiella trochoidea, Strain CCMP3099" /LENGTH=124 /DNA_ID=CAMNT_0002742077 /DNA_START=174 /DNA_END=549 /DNA_ORIENTATION=-